MWKQTLKEKNLLKPLPRRRSFCAWKYWSSLYYFKMPWKKSHSSHLPNGKMWGSVFFCEELSRHWDEKLEFSKLQTQNARSHCSSSLLPFKCLWSGTKTFQSGWVNFKVWFQNFEFWLAGRTYFCHACGQVVASGGNTLLRIVVVSLLFE